MRVALSAPSRTARRRSARVISSLQEVREQLLALARSAPTRGGTARPRPAARGGAGPSARRRRAPTPRGSRAAASRPPASGSGRPSSGLDRPVKIVRPSCSIVVALPCTGGCSRTVPPNACASAWWPRHTPSVGNPRCGHPPHELERDARLIRRAGARRDDAALIAALEQLIDARAVVADRARPRPPARPGTGRGCR